MSEIPDWLQNNQTADAELPTRSIPFSSAFEPKQQGTDTPRTTDMSSRSFMGDDPVASAMMYEDDGKGPSRNGCLYKLGYGLLYLSSLAFLAAHGYSIWEKRHDHDSTDGILWICFFGLHAALTILFIVARLTCSTGGGIVEKVLLGGSVLMLGWTGVMLWFSINDYTDEENAEWEDLLEVIGAGVGGLSVIFHLALWMAMRRSDRPTTTRSSSSRRRKKKKRNNGEDPTESDSDI